MPSIPRVSFSSQYGSNLKNYTKRISDQASTVTVGSQDRKLSLTTTDLRAFREGTGGIAYELSTGNLRSLSGTSELLFGILNNSPNTSSYNPSDSETIYSSTADKLYEHETDSETGEEGFIEEYKTIGTWGTYGIDDEPWKDEDRPVVNFYNYEDLILTDEEKSGYLTDRIIASCSSYLEKCPGTMQYVLCKCVLKQKGINDISLLYYHHFLQYIDLSYNKLDDLSPLSGLPYLMYLNVSHNKLAKLLDFKPPKNLTFVDFSYNLITEIPDLTAFWAIKTLNLSHNNIEVIQGVENLKYLEILNLSYNQIKRLQGLNHLRIIFLVLRKNKINSFETGDDVGLKTMPYLRYIRLGYNELHTLKLFEGAVYLQSIDMPANKIDDLSELNYLRDLRLLVYVNFERNPIKYHEEFETVCFETIKNLKFLGDTDVITEDKVTAKQLFSPDIKVQVAQDDANLVTLAQLAKANQVGLSLVPADQPPRPLVVVVGPVASRHDVLVKDFTNFNAHNTTRLINHTTRPRGLCENETNFYFVREEEFTKLVQQGEFLTMYEVLQDCYGLTQNEMFRCSEMFGKVMVTHADIYSALTLRVRGFRPWLVLAMPRNLETHKRWLAEMYKSSVLNTRFPEAAIKVENRESFHSETNSEKIFTDSTSSSQSDAAASQATRASRGSKFIVSIVSEDSDVGTSKTQNEGAEENESIGCFFGNKMDINLSEMEEEGESKRSSEENLTSTDEKSTASASASASENAGPAEVNIPLLDINQSESLEGEAISPTVPIGLDEDFYKKILSSRETYLEFHRSNPGLFYDIVYTDETENACETLAKVVKTAVKKQFKATPFGSYNNDAAFQSIVGSRLNMYDDDIDRFVKRDAACHEPS